MYPEVRTLEELEQHKDEQFVKAVCPKCGEAWTSLLANAWQILSKGCIVCAEWDPVVKVEVFL